MPSESRGEGALAPWTLGPIMAAPRARPGRAAIGDNGRA
jgi:hypothetical protein